MATTRQRMGWLLVESIPVAARYRVLLLPGVACTDLIFSASTAILEDRSLAEAKVYLIAGNPPGFKGLPVSEGFDFRIES